MSDSNRSDRVKAVAQAWFCALALIGTVVLAYAIGTALGIDSGRDQVSAREHYENAKNDALRACVGREGRAAIECVTKAIESAQAQSDSRQDLYAQQDMSKWAFWMLVATAITAGVTALGVWFVKRTLDATLEAVEDTSAATDAMRKANRIAEENAQRQSRAYLFVKSVTVDESVEDSDTLTLLVEIQNAGTTPGEIRKLVATLTWLSSPAVDLINSDLEHFSKIHRGTPYILPYEIPADRLDQCVKDGYFICMGRIDYTDVFGVKRSEPWTFRSVELVKHPINSVQLPYRMAGFSLPSVAKFTDERRKRQRKDDKK